MPNAENNLDWLERCSKSVRTIYEYWDSKRHGRLMPSRADIDPSEIRRLLPFMTLVDVVPDERRYVYRLVGTYEVKVRGNDPTGKSVIEGFIGPSAENALSCYDRAVEMRAPFFDDEPYTTPDGRFIDDEAVFLPLSDDGETVNMVLVLGSTTDTFL